MLQSKLVSSTDERQQIVAHHQNIKQQSFTHKIIGHCNSSISNYQNTLHELCVCVHDIDLVRKTHRCDCV